jgi:predicted TPR repeat methyltransferase
LAETAARQVLAMSPQDTRAIFMVALTCQQTGRVTEALERLQMIVGLDPKHVYAWVNKGLVEKQMGRYDDAILSLSTALTLDPAIAPACYSLGLIHVLRGAAGEAERAFRRALELDPDHTHAALQLGTLLRYENRIGEAADIYRAILTKDPANAVARFYLEAAGSADGPNRVPPAVVRAIYADESVGRSLEGSLQGHLRYQTPKYLDAALAERFGAAQPILDTLDLGCGSGLYGALVRPRSRRLVGVDLSAAMIEECRRKRVYDDLRVMDVVDYLAKGAERYDLIIAMDVFCYFGDLRPLFSACAAILKPGGTLACSVERAPPGSEWKFHRYGHFLHSAEHLRDAARIAQLRVIDVTECTLRHEFGEDRIGFVGLFAR